MSKKLLPEKDLLEGLTSHTAHTDEFATTSEKDGGAYSEGAPNFVRTNRYFKVATCTLNNVI
ncbi:hypothetical protein FT122_20080 [Vibrio alginolyticus]|nr:hypothetical protein [Vibrio alginolyticus]